MRNLAATVTLVTTRDGAGPHGIAASAVMGVSSDPPTLLVSVAQSSSLHRPLLGTGCFCVNILGSDQADLLLPFASSDLRSRRFADGSWHDGLHGLPFLPSAIAVLFCAVVQRVDHGLHSLFIGEVEGVAEGHSRAPLVWYDGARADLEPAGRPS